MRCFDKYGVEITPEQMMELKRDRKYSDIRQTTLADGKWISTVWLGMDHSFGDDAVPVIFETMVFPKHGNWNELESDRYTDIEDAKAGHDEMVIKWNSSPEVRFEWNNVGI